MLARVDDFSNLSRQSFEAVVTLSNLNPAALITMKKVV
jgi:hypothetical protein